MSQNKLLALLLDDYLKEEACMKYINAKDILPNALVKDYRITFRVVIFMFQLINCIKSDGERFLAIDKNCNNETNRL